MAQINLSYSVRDLFTKALPNDFQATQFVITAYQRGYKWKATGHVRKLLLDLLEAFNQEAPDYYLQYITVKSTAAQQLEVIDGQQRLTTLSVFFAVCEAEGYLEESFTNSCLRYAIREEQLNGETTRRSLLDAFIYHGAVTSTLALGSWDQFIQLYPAANRQDMYHLFAAAKEIQRFLQDNIRSAEEGIRFAAYVADKARLIVNAVSQEGTHSETTFSNLNTNRVDLTDLDLVKGLLLTRVGREQTRAFQQIVEYRAAQGRYWDEMTHWLRLPGVETVFGFKEGEGMATLVDLMQQRLPTLSEGKKKNAVKEADSRFPLFTALHHRLGRGKNKEKASRVFAEIRLLYALLRDWYADPETHNYLGVLRVSLTYSGKANLLRELTTDSVLQKQGAKAYLQAQLKSLACLKPLEKADEDTYLDAGGTEQEWAVTYADEKHRPLIRDFLLLLNVFPEQARLPDHQVRFDFAKFSAQNWSLEHLYPQNPRESFADLTPDDQKVFLSLVPGVETEEAITIHLRRPSDEATASNAVLEDALKQAAGKLHGLGNMVLLDGKTNSSLSNKSFDKKRARIVEKVEQGKFIPPHTFGVFSKLLPKEAEEKLHVWTSRDIDLHEKYLLIQRQQLIAYFAPHA